MPFKSEKQRKYLWANEPEIARDWTDTYGSKIHKADGGIMRRRYFSGAYGQGAGDRGGNPNASRSENIGAGRAPEQGPAHLSHNAPNPPKKYIKPLPETNKGEQLNTYLNQKMPNLRHKYNLNARTKFINNNIDALVKAGLIEMGGTEGDAMPVEGWNWTGPKDITSMAGLKELQELGYTGGKLNPAPDRGEGQPYIYPPTGIASIDDTATQTASTSNLGSNHYQVPLAQVYNQTRAADGGRIGYQMGNMVGAEMEGAEMEGAEMEGAVMQSQEVIKELYDALIAQGLSPEEAMEKIKEMIASSQTQEPQSPMMGEEFPGQEFGRAPAAYGGIMDTYTGRRKYGWGSFNPFKAVKKGVSKLKKLASSKLGKIALGYIATAGLSNYLAGAQGVGGLGAGQGQAWKSMKWLNPTNVIGNIGTTGTKAAGLFSGGAEKKVVENVVKDKVPWYKNPWVTIPAASTAAGLYTAQQPEEDLDDAGGEWQKQKDKFDAYLASLDTEDSYRVPENLRLAQGGRIGRQEGGLMNLGGMEKDYRNDGGFVPLGGEEKADDVPARLSKNEFVFTADAVRNAGGGDIDRGAEVMENVMKNLEAGGQVSEESQGQGAQEMFETSERLSEVI